MSISLQDMTDGSPAARNFAKLAQLVIDTGGQSIGIRFGVGIWTWPGGTATSNDVTVTHGLGRTPVFAAALGSQQHGLGEVVDGNTFTYTATTFTTRGVFVKGFTPAAATTASFVWLVIG